MVASLPAYVSACLAVCVSGRCGACSDGLSVHPFACAMALVRACARLCASRRIRARVSAGVRLRA
eukprot:2033001-Alexandrium_andersonii.AAC.1